MDFLENKFFLLAITFGFFLFRFQTVAEEDRMGVA